MAQKLLTDETGRLILQAIKELDTVALNKIGNLTGLNTSNKASLVAAINELLTQRGALNSLTTSDKTSIVLAINEVWDTLNTRTSFINDAENANAAYRAGFHNSLFRGKSLGSSITSAQWTAIRNGTFEEMFIGDYWDLGGVRFRIAHFDYYYNTNTIVMTPGFKDANDDVLPASCVVNTKFTPHHIVVIPDNKLGIGPMNTEDTKDHFYINCYYRTNQRRSFITQMEQEVGAEHLMYWGDTFAQSSASNYYGANNTAMYIDAVCQAELPSLLQLTGHHAIMQSGLPASAGSSHNLGRVPGQFALMRHDTAFIRPGLNVYEGAPYLRDVVAVPEDYHANRPNDSVVFGCLIQGCIWFNNVLENRPLRPYFCLMG